MKASHTTKTSMWLLQAWLIKIKKCKSQFSLWMQIMRHHPQVVKHTPTFYQLRIWVCQPKVRSLEALEKYWNRINASRTICDMRGTYQPTLRTTLWTILQPLFRARSSPISQRCDLQSPSALVSPLTKPTDSSLPHLKAVSTQKDTLRTKTMSLRVKLW